MPENDIDVQALRNAGIPVTSGDLDARQTGDDDAELAEVPDGAEDVRSWIRGSTDPAEQARRADLAERAEDARGSRERSTVRDAIAETRAS